MSNKAPPLVMFFNKPVMAPDNVQGPPMPPDTIAISMFL